MKRLLFIILFICIGCDDTTVNQPVKKVSSPEQIEQEPEEIDKSEPEQQTEIVLDNPQKTPQNEPIIIQEAPIVATKKLAELYYDTNLVSIDKDFALSHIDNTESYLRSGVYYADGKDIYKDKSTTPIITGYDIQDFRVYDNIIFYASTTGNLYMIDQGVETFIDKQFGTYKWNFTDKGIYSMLKSVDTKTGSVTMETGESYIGYDHVIKSVSQPTGYYKISYDNIEIGSTTQPSHLYKAHSYLFNDKIYFSRGVTIDLVTMKADHPTYRPGIGWTGGNLFVFILNSGMRQHKYYFLGDDGNETIYCIDSYDGKFYKYDTGQDVLTAWLPLLAGCDSDDYGIADNWFYSAGFFMLDGWLIYFDGQYVKRFNVKTQENIVLTEATDFKGWAL